MMLTYKMNYSEPNILGELLKDRKLNWDDTGGNHCLTLMKRTSLNHERGFSIATSLGLVDIGSRRQSRSNI